MRWVCAIVGWFIGKLIFGSLFVASIFAGIGYIVGYAIGEKSGNGADTDDDPNVNPDRNSAGDNGETGTRRNSAGGSSTYTTYTYVGGNCGYTHVGGSSSSGNNRFEHLFRSFGKLAKLDGQVTQAEADLVTSFLRKLGLPSADKKLLIAAFNRGKTSTEPFSGMVETVKNNFPSAQYRELMQFYCDLVLADGTIRKEELELLRAAERVFGLNGFVNSWYDSIRDKSETETPPTDDLDWAYRILGVSPRSTPDEIKQAWRDKAKEYHPDKLRGKNASPKLVKLAENKFRQAQNAYEQIKRARNF